MELRAIAELKHKKKIVCMCAERSSSTRNIEIAEELAAADREDESAFAQVAAH